MRGDQQDMLSRLKQVLPLRWFPDDTPVLDTMLAGVAWAWAWVYGLLQTAKSQARISTAYGVWLDFIAQDYFGSWLIRSIGENDDQYRLRIQLELVRERGTRRAVISQIEDLTARPCVVFDPRTPWIPEDMAALAAKVAEWLMELLAVGGISHCHFSFS